MHKTLYFQVLLAIVIGVTLGAALPDVAVEMKPLADMFIKLIKMLIAPVIFCTVVIGIAGMEGMKHAGRVGFKALVYFEVMTTLALFIGLAVVNLWQPGAGMHIDPASLDAEALSSYTSKASISTSPVEFALHLVPTTIFDAFAKGDILQVLLVAILFACALVALGERGRGVYALVQQVSDVLFKMIGFIVLLAPLGAFGAMAFTVGKYGVEILTSLAALMFGFYVTCALFVAVALGIIMRFCGLRIWPFLKYIKDEILIVLGTSSSEAALPRMIDKMIRLGCGRQVVNMVVPTGYSFNLDGTCIYLTMAAVFIAQALDIPLSLSDQMTLIGVLLFTSKGAAGITGSGFIVLAGTLSTVGNVPVEGLALILGIDRFMSEGRAITNLIGNGVATVAVAWWEKTLDLGKAREALGIGHQGG